MDIITSLNLATASELGLTGLLIGITVQAIKKTGKVKNTYLPFISIGIGIGAGLVAVVVTKDTNYLNGAATSGLTDGLSVGTTVLTTVKATKDAAKTAAIIQAVLTSINTTKTSDVTQVADTSKTEGGNTSETQK